MSKHTPGPWHVSHVKLGGIASLYVDSGGFGSICKVAYKTNGAENANASLLAIAPELLETLKECINGLDCQPGYIRSQTVIRAQQLIAKAEGKL